MNKKVIGLGVLAAAGAGAVIGARREVAKVAATHAPGPEGDAIFVPPADVEHREIPAPDGGTIHYVERGRGQPLVLLHGVTLRWDIWSPQLHALADHYRIIAVDLRGHGQSKHGDHGYGLPVLGNDLATLLTTLDLHDALVVGHSMGGMTTLRFCVDHPDVLAERVAGIGLVATAASMPLPAPAVALLSKPGQRIVDRIESGATLPAYSWKDGVASTLLVRVAFGKNPPGAAVAQVREMSEAIPADNSALSWIKILEHDTRHALADVDVPSFVVVGTRDALTPPPNARVIAELLPGCELQVLAGCGHQVMQERPTELAQLIDQLAARGRTTGGDHTAVVSADA
jgi:pimeloyl-ACP methyl ester carboxylesterase